MHAWQVHPEAASRRPPALVTSSTESFKSGLVSYAQLQQHAPPRGSQRPSLSPAKSARTPTMPAVSIGNVRAWQCPWTHCLPIQHAHKTLP